MVVGVYCLEADHLEDPLLSAYFRGIYPGGASGPAKLSHQEATGASQRARAQCHLPDF